MTFIFSYISCGFVTTTLYQRYLKHGFDLVDYVLMKIRQTVNVVNPVTTGNFANCQTRFDGSKHSDVTEFIDAIEIFKNCMNITEENSLCGLPMLLYELFASEQDSKTPTDVFVCKSRALLAQLPRNTLSESIQLDMVYGLLHRRIREKVSREKIETFTDLLNQARLLEEAYPEDSQTRVYKTDDKRHRCNYCKNYGHSKDVENCPQNKSKYQQIHLNR
ncbi:hypothetical protein RN001_004099 [Aquatica leii]|uniref:Uncharacterized protein n=1 Tax=Aquatica leii TaxID=1421715 RepID=A0AAN7PJI1_9COLE|nr:hypothetical protein RN001_004099 [Aquatica leii]